MRHGTLLPGRDQRVLHATRRTRRRRRVRPSSKNSEPSGQRWRDAQLLRRRSLTQPRAVFSPRPGLESLRPDQRTPVPGLLLAGDWTRTGWPATMERAIRSGGAAAKGHRNPCLRKQFALAPARARRRQPQDSPSEPFPGGRARPRYRFPLAERRGRRATGLRAHSSPRCFPGTSRVALAALGLFVELPTCP